MAVTQTAPSNPTVKRHSALSLLAHPKGIWNFLRAEDAPKSAKLVALVAAAYIVWPADLIPDIAPVLGWLDDVGMAGIALAFLARQAAEYADTHEAPARVAARVTRTR